MFQKHFQNTSATETTGTEQNRTLPTYTLDGLVSEGGGGGGLYPE